MNTVPYWSNIPNPLIINTNGTNLEGLKNAIKINNRFCILYEAMSEKPDYSLFMDNDAEENEDFQLTQPEKDFLFESDFEFVQIQKAPMPYLKYIFQHLLESFECDLSPTVDCEAVILQLMNYRGRKFESVNDLERIILKALRYSKDDIIEESAFNRLLMKETVTMKDENREGKALKELNKLVGLTDVKEQLLRIVDRMKLTEMRKQAGFSNIDHHMAAVFMGNPGTAKTTIARIFGQLLFESKVLTNNVFVEVSRKDLIGKFVGWTSHKVQEVFDNAKGGTVFIDEAYSLVNKTDGYSDEAFSAIIQNMENNPDTLVIFAGYTNEMLDFIRNTNPGLRSRLTNVIQFDDYDEKQMLDIFYYHVNRAGYELENKESVDQSIIHFIKKMSRFDQRQVGNGRLMRKLLSTSVGYMAQRKPENINLLLMKDIQSACKELFEAESIIQIGQTERKVGFSI